MKLSDLKLKDHNPRQINDDKFQKLIQSIKAFPKMLTLRPIVYNPDTMEVLGGNMRILALKELGYEDIPPQWVKSASDLDENERKRFLIVDNLNFGDWDMDLIANEWDEKELEDWGFDLPIDIIEGVKEGSDSQGNGITLKVSHKSDEEINGLFFELVERGFKVDMK